MSLSLLSLCVWKLVPFKCLFSFSPASEGISALKTTRLRGDSEEFYKASVQTDVEVESSHSQLPKNVSCVSDRRAVPFLFWRGDDGLNGEMLFKTEADAGRPGQQNVSIFRG